MARLTFQNKYRCLPKRKQFYFTDKFSVAEPVERQIFAGAGAEVFWTGSGSGYVNSYKMLQKAIKLSYKNLKLSLKMIFFIAIYFKKPFDDHLCF
jgi:hypothetical protein